MGKFYETSEFKNLEKAWYSKLKESGFEDAEKKGWLVQVSSYPFRHHPTEGLREARLNYYIFLGQGLACEQFRTPRDQKVMEMRCQGARIKDIVRALALEGYQIHRQTVRFIIRRFEAKWKIRHWEKRQLSSNQATA